jgi:hypothetical protein
VATNTEAVYKIRVDKYSEVSKEQYVEYHTKQAEYWNKRADEREGKELDEKIAKLKAKHKKEAQEYRAYSRSHASDARGAK